MSRTAIGSPDDWGRWLPLLAALAAAGVLPKRWQKGLGLAGALWLFFRSR